MWGSLCTELVNLYNFNVSFSTHKSEILIHLSQWQYWWWFWFSFFWTFYFFMILRAIKHRVFKMNARVNTSFRSRGKWGDYLVTLIPLSWCLNILLNSNFILRMIEWQSESNSLIIRIHGKQWYWIYKYDLSNVMSVVNTPKNIGHDRWVSTDKDGITVHDKYRQAALLKIRYTSQKEYWDEVTVKDFNPLSVFKVSSASLHNATNKNNNLDVINGSVAFSDFKNIDGVFFKSYETPYEVNSFESIDEMLYRVELKPIQFFVYPEDPYHTLNILRYMNFNRFFYMLVDDETDQVDEEAVALKCRKNKYTQITKTLEYPDLLAKLRLTNPTSLYFYENTAIDDDWEVYSNVKVATAPKPIRIMLATLNQQFMDNGKKDDVLLLRFNDSNDIVAEKVEENIDFVVVKQKRYKRKQGIDRYWVDNFEDYTNTEISKKLSGKNSTSRYLHNNLIIKQITDINSKKNFNFYSSMRLGRARSETFSVNLSRRLLRTSRTLVVPAFTNICLIANSYDVVHSWFIPGLGIKIDCVPGKSTHHSLYIDNVGLYYGQCAEICGRYHHHMPIKICALPFEHFVVWWTSKGIPKSIRMRYSTKKLEKTLLYKYTW